MCLLFRVRKPKLVGTSHRPWDPSEEALKRRQSEQLGLEEDDEEDDFNASDRLFNTKGPDAVPSRLSANRLGTKKFMWTVEEDRFVLEGYAKYAWSTSSCCCRR